MSTPVCALLGHPGALLEPHWLCVASDETLVLLPPAPFAAALMRLTFLLPCLLLFAPPLPAKSSPPALPLALEQCSFMISKLYRGRLPYSQLSEAVVRDKVECTTGFTKPAQVVHHEHVQARYNAHERHKIKTSMGTKGLQNPMVKGLCEQSGYTSLLAFVDLSYRFYLDGVVLGEVRVSADMCSSG